MFKLFYKSIISMFGWIAGIFIVFWVWNTWDIIKHIIVKGHMPTGSYPICSKCKRKEEKVGEYAERRN